MNEQDETPTVIPRGDGTRGVKEISLQGVTPDLLQRRRLHLPRGDVLLADGRKLREIMGYKRAMRIQLTGMIDDATLDARLETRGYQHTPSDFIVTGAIEKTDDWGPLLHVAMSYADHAPTWDDIKLVRAAFFPADVDVMQMLPRDSNYVNVHLYCHHLWQVPQHWNIG